MSFSVRGPGLSPAALRAPAASFELGVGRLSSGLRIRTAADDAAGLVISERMRAQSVGSTTAIRNVHDGINLLQTAEGGMAAITGLLQRARELAVQALSTGTTTQGDRDAAAAEIRQLVAEIDRTAVTTGFNGHRVLDGSRGGAFSLQVGAASGDVLAAASYDLTAGALALTGGTSALGAPTVSTWSTSSQRRDTFTLSDGSFTFAVGGAAPVTVRVAAGTYGTRSAHVTLEQALAGALSAAGLAVSVTRDTNNNGRSKFTFTAADATQQVVVSGTGARDMGIDAPAVTSTTAAATTPTSTGSSLADLVTEGREDALTLCDRALSTVLGARADVGALQNRLEHRLGVLAAVEHNALEGRSRLVDADVAKEWSRVVRAQVLTQAGTALQAQASAGGQRVLQLLGSL